MDVVNRHVFFPFTQKSIWHDELAVECLLLQILSWNLTVLMTLSPNYIMSQPGFLLLAASGWWRLQLVRRLKTQLWCPRETSITLSFSRAVLATPLTCITLSCVVLTLITSWNPLYTDTSLPLTLPKLPVGGCMSQTLLSVTEYCPIVLSTSESLCSRYQKTDFRKSSFSACLFSRLASYLFWPVPISCISCLIYKYRQMKSHYYFVIIENCVHYTISLFYSPYDCNIYVLFTFLELLEW